MEDIYREESVIKQKWHLEKRNVFTYEFANLGFTLNKAACKKMDVKMILLMRLNTRRLQGLLDDSL